MSSQIDSDLYGQPDRPDDDEPVIVGTVEHILFHSADDGYCVLKVKAGDDGAWATLVGAIPFVEQGDTVEARGSWSTHKVHGRQFKASSIQVVPPTTLEGIEKYLGSGLIKGVGPHLAGRLVAVFGKQIFDILDRSPERLREIDGIGAKKLARIIDSWADQKLIQDTMVFLQSHGIGNTRAIRIYKTYGADAVALIRADPYRLTRDIAGIGFLTADRFAENLGFDTEAETRLRAGLSHALEAAVSSGHCGLPLDELLDDASALLDIDRDRVDEILASEIDAGLVRTAEVDGRMCCFLTPYWVAEQTIADRLNILAGAETAWRSTVDPEAIDTVEEALGVTFADGQRRALEQAIAAKLMVITGGPGVGKTTLVNAVLMIVSEHCHEIALAAPTGRAAKRLAESTGREAKTIHRLLEIDPADGGFRRNADNPLKCDLLVVDEASMIDVQLMASLLLALPEDAALLIVGDADQLPSVGPGQVLADILEADRFPVARLTEIYRQGEGSRIVHNAHRVNQGEMPSLKTEKGEDTDFYFIEAADPDDCIGKLVEVVSNRLPRAFDLDPMTDIQVLCPVNRGPLGTAGLNDRLQAVLNGTEGPSVERQGQTFKSGDKVMQTRNDYDKDVFNGDIGTIETVSLSEKKLRIVFDGRNVDYGFDELDELSLAYAVTIHKSQGSEYPAVVIVLMARQHFRMLRRNLLYTAMTRGRRLVVVIGQQSAVRTATEDASAERRWSRLRELLAAS